MEEFVTVRAEAVKDVVRLLSSINDWAGPLLELLWKPAPELSDDGCTLTGSQETLNELWDANYLLRDFWLAYARRLVPELSAAVGPKAAE